MAFGEYFEEHQIKKKKPFYMSSRTDLPAAQLVMLIITNNKDSDHSFNIDLIFCA